MRKRRRREFGRCVLLIPYAIEPESKFCFMKYVQDTTPRLKIISPTLSSESLTHERDASSGINQGSGFETAGTNFRTTPSSTEEHAAHHGSTEVSQTREGVIQEIFETEEDLLHLLRICMRLFVIPLRVQNSRTWITGLPPTVARLLDWFDDMSFIFTNKFTGHFVRRGIPCPQRRIECQSPCGGLS
jgi:hypothetical protein